MNMSDDAILTELPFGLPGRVYRSPMPFSSYDPLDRVWDGYKKQAIDVVVVLTEPQEYLVYAKMDLPDFYHSKGLDVIAAPIRDFSAPSDGSSYLDALTSVEQLLRSRKNVAVHCLAGVGRTGTFLACLAKRILGMDSQAAIDWVRQHIPGALESIRQESFVMNFEDPL